ncbi:MAG TPA: hypothetical protein VGZ02_11235 [Candidatus Baltobacteraceae bacterium]|nr:hypothetical protein [Candidatus Baltobacteraceae bacterium]
MTRLYRDVAFIGIALVLAACSGNHPASLPTSSVQDASSAHVDSTAALPAYTFVALNNSPNGSAGWAQGADKTTQGGNFVYSHGSCGKDCSFPIYHAVVWSGSGSTAVDITPPLTYFPEAWVLGGTGSMLVGYGITNQGGYYGVPHALLWRGTTFTWKDLNPAGDNVSHAYAASGNFIVGSGAGTSGGSHALLWNVTKLSSVTDLHPSSAYASSEALGVKGAYQFGYAMNGAVSDAMFWNGTSASAVDLTTASGASAARAWAGNAAGTLQAGCGVPSGGSVSHALIWKGTSHAVADLNPSGFSDSCAVAFYNGIEAGSGHVGGYLHALVWAGTAKSALDLENTLPSGYTQSQATAIDSNGNVIGDVYNGTWHAAMWIP